MTDSTHFGLVSHGGPQISPRRFSHCPQNGESDGRLQVGLEPVPRTDPRGTHTECLEEPKRRQAGGMPDGDDTEDETAAQVQLSISQLVAAAVSMVFDDKVHRLDGRERTLSEDGACGAECVASALVGACGPDAQPLHAAGLPDAPSSPSTASLEKLREVINLITNLGIAGDGGTVGQQIGIRLNGKLFAGTTLTISSEEKFVQVHCRSSSASEADWFSRHAQRISSQLEGRLKRRVRFVVSREEN